MSHQLTGHSRASRPCRTGFDNRKLAAPPVVDEKTGDPRNAAGKEGLQFTRVHAELRDQMNRTLGVLSKMLALTEIWDLRPDGPSLQGRKDPSRRAQPIASGFR